MDETTDDHVPDASCADSIVMVTQYPGPCFQEIRDGSRREETCWVIDDTCLLQVH